MSRRTVLSVFVLGALGFGIFACSTDGSPATNPSLVEAGSSVDAAPEAMPPRDGGSGNCLEKGASCPAGTVCVAADCRTGTCQTTSGLSDASAGSHACGCDGLEYWSVELAAKIGAPIRAVRACEDRERRGCSTTDPCPLLNAVCAERLDIRSSCQTAFLAGHCYVVPDTCPAQGGEKIRTCLDGLDAGCSDSCTRFRKFLNGGFPGEGVPDPSAFWASMPFYSGECKQ